MRRFVVVASAAGLLATAPVLAQQTAGEPSSIARTAGPPGSVGQAAGDQAEERRICRNERVTGSLTRVNRICMTQREWDAVAQRTRDGVGRLDRDAARNAAGGGSGPGGS
jgi:hypothetical protein